MYRVAAREGVLVARPWQTAAAGRNNAGGWGSGRRGLLPSSFADWAKAIDRGKLIEIDAGPAGVAALQANGSRICSREPRRRPLLHRLTAQ